MLGNNQLYYDLLGSAQTFVGVLLTLNVLCIFLDRNSNFIFGIISAQNRKFLRLLAEQQTQLEAEIKKFSSIPEYQSLQRLRHSNRKEIMSEASALHYRCAVKILNFNVDLTDMDPALTRIENYKEQVLAPVFSLAFGILIFCFDEIGRFILLPAPAYTFGIFLLTILSSCYWLILWITYQLHSSHSGHEEKQDATIWDHLVKQLGTLDGSFVKLAISGVIYYLLLIYLPWDLMNDHGVILLNILAFLLPIATIGGIRIWRSRIKGQYSYLHVLGHLIAMTIYTVIMVILFTIFSPVEFKALGVLVEVKILRAAIVAFLMLNGIIAPFLFPYLRCKSLFEKRQEILKKSFNNLSKEIYKFKDDYKALYLKINET